MQPRIPTPGRYALARIATRPTPPTVQPPRGLCSAPAPQGARGTTTEPHDPWHAYAAQLRAGLVHPPSVSTRTAVDVARQQAAIGGGRREP